MVHGPEDGGGAFSENHEGGEGDGDWTLPMGLHPLTPRTGLGVDNIV